MTSPSTRSALPVAALLAAALGLALTVASAVNAPRRVAAIRRREADAVEARRLRDELARREAIRRLWLELPDARLPAPETLLRTAARGLAAPEVIERDAEPLADGWRRRRVEIVFPEAPLDMIGRFLAAAAAARPPWRLAEIRVLASDSGRGYGRATATLDGLERAGREESP